MGVRLPAEYQEVEYIEATGTQYIQTSYTPQNADEVVCDFALVSSITGASNAQALFSAGTGTNQLIFLLNNTAGSTPVNGAYYKYFASGNASRLFFYPSYDTKYRLEIDNDGTANCNGYSVQSHYEGTVDTALCLMQRAKGGSSFKGKCYQFILSNGGEEKLNLIPCYRKSDNKPGMYDLVSGEFFTNAGTGEFEVGPDVIDSISPWLVAWRRIMMAAASVAKKLVKLIATSTTGLVSFDTNVEMPVKVTCEFSPVQEGTGDPSPDNVRPISGWTSATIYHTGKNVWGGRHAADQIKSVAGSKANFSSDDDGDYISLAGVVGDAKKLSLDVKFKPNTAYTLILKARCSAKTNFTIRIFYTDGTQLALSPSATYSETRIYRIVTDANKTVRGVYTFNRSQTLYIYYDYFGLFEGSISADDFEPYQDSTFTINWQSEAGTVYGGTVTLNEDGSADLVVTDAIATITGGLNAYPYRGNYSAYIVVSPRMASGSLLRGTSSYMPRSTSAVGSPPYSFSNGWNDNPNRIYLWGIGRIVASDLGISVGDVTAAQVNQYMLTHPLQVSYPLKTPTTYHFDNIGQLNSFLGENNIWHDMNGSITAEYYKKQ